MAEATASGNSDGEKDIVATTEIHLDVDNEPYRNICDHYSRGCSLLVSVSYIVKQVHRESAVIKLTSQLTETVRLKVFGQISGLTVMHSHS